MRFLRSFSIKNDLSPLLTLAIPMVLSNISQSSIGFFETAFLARLGPTLLAAGALVAWLFATLIVILFGIFSSVNTIIAHKHGAKDVDGIALVFYDGLVLAMLLVIPTFFLIWNSAYIFLLFGQDPALVQLAKPYLHGLAFGLLPKFIMIVFFEFLMGLGHSRTILIFTLFSIPVYIFFSFVLIFGKFGFPELHIAGAGWGMTVGDWITSSAVCCYVLSSQHYRVYIRSLFHFKKLSYIWEILHLGVPMGLMYCIEVGFFFVVTLLMGLISVHALAANQVTMQYAGLLAGIMFCTAQAVTVRMGHQLGANQIESAERAGYLGILLSVGLMLVVAVFYCFFPELLIRVDFDVNNPANLQTVLFAKQFFFIAAFFQILEAIRIALFGALRALRDTRYTLFTSIIGFWGLSLPLGYLLSIKLNFGGVGLWWGMMVGVICNMTLLYIRFNSKMEREKRKEILV